MSVQNGRLKYRHEAAARVMHLLDCFSESEPELRLTDLSRRLEMDKAQVLRLASTLETGGFLVRDPGTKRYRLGVTLLRLGALVQRRLDVRQAARPHLERLVEETQETARLVVPNADGPICVEVVDSPRGIRVFAQPGARMPWNAGASPRTILAFLPKSEQEWILSQTKFRSYNEHTTTDPEELRLQIEEIRTRGYLLAGNDLDDGATGVSAPVFGSRGEILGAINVSAPSHRLTGDDTDRFIELVVAAAQAISRELGYSGAPANS